MKNPRTLRFVFSLLITAALPVAGGLTLNPMGLLSGIKSAEAQEWPLLKESGTGCTEIQGIFQNVGEDAPLNNRGSRFPPRLSFDVLSSGRPGSKIAEVAIETLNDATLRFRFVEQSGEVSETKEFNSTCENGWRVFSFTLPGMGEGYRGIATTNVRLAIAADGSLLAYVIRNSQGKDFYLVPRSSLAELKFRFLKEKEAE